MGATLFVYRRRERAELPRFLVPLYPLVPGFFVSAAIFTVVSSIAADIRNASLGAVLILLGIPVFFAWRRHRGRMPEGS